MPAIGNAVLQAAAMNVAVLSPSSPEVVDRKGGFVFVASDEYRSVRMTEDRHLDAIKRSDLVWLVCPDGDVGISAAMEVAFASALRIPVFCSTRPRDETVAQYVKLASDLKQALSLVGKSNNQVPSSILLSPQESIANAQVELGLLASALAAKPGQLDDARGWKAYQHWQALRSLLEPPTGW